MYNVDYQLKNANDPIRKEAVKHVKAKFPTFDPVKGAGVGFTLAILVLLAFLLSAGLSIKEYTVPALCVAVSSSALTWFLGQCDVRPFMTELRALEEQTRKGMTA